MLTMDDSPTATLSAVDALRDRLNAVLRGKANVVQNVLVCLLAGGHLLLEDRPGLGKTTLAKGLADAVGGRFARIQCTPDLLPGDITGFNLFNQRVQEFEFRRGPVFSDVLLADEINRATPRTQSALLEAMAERQVTVDGERYRLSTSFFVIATQNPQDQHGTYPLPEAQLDRFAMKLSVGYPATEDELDLLVAAVGDFRESRLDGTALLEPGQLVELQAFVAATPVVESVQRYLVALAQATRTHARISLGISPRGLLMWQRCAQAAASLDGRRFVTPDDVLAVAEPVLSVRLGVDAEDSAFVIRDVLQSVTVPGG